MGASLSVHSEATKNQSAISGRNYHFELDCHYTKKARPKGLTLQFPSKGLTLRHIHFEGRLISTPNVTFVTQTFPPISDLCQNNIYVLE